MQRLTSSSTALFNSFFSPIEMFQFKPNNADSSFIAGGLVATDLYQEQIKESVQASKKIVEQYKKFLAEKEVYSLYLGYNIDSKII